MKKNRLVIDINSPTILWMAAISLVVLILDNITGDMFTRNFASYRTSWSDPMQYVRLFTHVLVHADAAHYVSNFMMMLAIGPMVEEKYRSINLCIFIIIAAFITGLINVLFFPAEH